MITIAVFSDMPCWPRINKSGVLFPNPLTVERTCRVLYTDAKGRFQTKVENDATVMVEALGYEDKVYKLTGSNIVRRLSL